MQTSLWVNDFPLLSFKDINFEGPDSQINGFLNFNVHTFIYEGQLSGTLSDLSHYSQWIGQPIKGALTFKASKTEDKSTISAFLSDFSNKDIAAKSLSFEGQLKQLEPENIIIKSKNFFFNLGSLTFDNMNFTLSSQGEDKKISLMGDRGDKKINVQANLSQKNQSEMVAVLTDFKLTDGKDSLIWIGKPTSLFVFSPEKKSINCKFLTKNGYISVNNLGIYGNLSGTIDIRSFPLDLLFFFSDDKPLSGNLDANIKLEGTKNNPILESNLQGVLRDTSTKFGKKGVAVKIISYKIKGTQKNNLLTFKTSITCAKKLFLNGEGTLKTTGFPKLSDPINAHFKLNGNLNALNSFVLVNDKFDGKIEGSLELRNVLEKPILTGNLDLKNGAFEDSEMGTIIKNISAKGHIQNSDVKLSTCTFQDFSKGRGTCAGGINFQDIASPFLNLNVSFKDYVIINAEDFKAKANGTLSLKTQKADNKIGHILISGEVDVLKGEYTLQDTSDIHKIIKVYEDPSLLKEGLKKDYAITHEKGIFILNINVHLKDYFYIYGFGLNSQWNGHLNITGNADRGQLAGQLNLVKGTLMVSNKPMTLKQGVVTFDGAKDKDPTVLMVANREISGYETFLRLEGKASRIKITVGAIPNLTQDQALSLILFGKALNNVTPAQSIQLALAMGNLKILEDIVSQIRLVKLLAWTIYPLNKMKLPVQIRI